jgi:hypothetical protein
LFQRSFAPSTETFCRAGEVIAILHYPTAGSVFTSPVLALCLPPIILARFFASKVRTKDVIWMQAEGSCCPSVDCYQLTSFHKEIAALLNQGGDLDFNMSTALPTHSCNVSSVLLISNCWNLKASFSCWYLIARCF